MTKAGRGQFAARVLACAGTAADVNTPLMSRPLQPLCRQMRSWQLFLDLALSMQGSSKSSSNMPAHQMKQEVAGLIHLLHLGCLVRSAFDLLERGQVVVVAQALVIIVD